MIELFVVIAAGVAYLALVWAVAAWAEKRNL